MENKTKARRLAWTGISRCALPFIGAAIGMGGRLKFDKYQV